MVGRKAEVIANLSSHIGAIAAEDFMVERDLKSPAENC